MMVLEELLCNCMIILINDYGYVLYNILRVEVKCFLKLSLLRNYCYCFKIYKYENKFVYCGI